VFLLVPNILLVHSFLVIFTAGSRDEMRLGGSEKETKARNEQERSQWESVIELSGVGVDVCVASWAGVAIFDLDYDAILAAMYAVTISDEGDYYRCFPPDPGIEAAALGA
ncbi:unnamed protein product, partial [Closterium sp. NIES-53]